LYEILAPYTRNNGIGETLLSPADLELSPTRLLQPDLFVVPADVKTASWKEMDDLGVSVLLQREVVVGRLLRWLDGFNRVK
jgi:hypothetical protein